MNHRTLLICAVLAAGAMPRPAWRQAEIVAADTGIAVKESEWHAPARGMTMSQVASKFGAPVSKVPAVGKPPISRWEYPGFVVYFEHDHVIHSVVAGSPPEAAPAASPAGVPRLHGRRRPRPGHSARIIAHRSRKSRRIVDSKAHRDSIAAGVFSFRVLKACHRYSTPSCRPPTPPVVKWGKLYGAAAALAIAEAAAKAAGAADRHRRNPASAETLERGDRLLRRRGDAGARVPGPRDAALRQLLGASGHHLGAASRRWPSCRARGTASGWWRSTR